MFLDRNVLVEYRAQAVSDILRECKLEDTFVIFRGREHICTVRNVKKEGLEIKLSSFKEPIKTNDAFQFVITVDGKKYILKVRLSLMKFDEEAIVCNLDIISKIPIDLMTHLEEMERKIEAVNERKFDRIYLDEETLKTFEIEPKIMVLFPERQYACFVKNISVNGIAFVTTLDFMNEYSDKYALQIKFKNPQESIHLVGQIVRKVEIDINGKMFLECAMQLEDNVHLNARIIQYFKNGRLLKSILKRAE